MMASIESARKHLGKYLPEASVDYVIDLLRKFPCKFKISKPRKTKLGDYRMTTEGISVITVNGDLHPYSFLITTIHEFAHLITFNEYGRRIKAHGKEWQNNYRKLLLPMINEGVFPAEIENALMKSLITVKASSCSDTNLYRTLSKYEAPVIDHHPLEELPIHATFQLNGRVFTKGNLRRSRYVCTENNTQRTYLVHALAKVKKHEE